jgi:hypothetical protein
VHRVALADLLLPVNLERRRRRHLRHRLQRRRHLLCGLAFDAGGEEGGGQGGLVELLELWGFVGCGLWFVVGLN